MKSFALGISIFLVIVGAYASRNYQLESSQEVRQEVLSQSEDGPYEEKQPSADSSPTVKPTQPSPKQESSPTSSISDYFYPGSSIKSQSQSSAILESSDNPDKITEWYKDKINSKKMNAVSFVTTSANDSVINQLEAASEDASVSVEIKKEPGSATSVISVSISP